MALMPVTLPPGVVRTATPAMSRGRYWDTSLVRWRGGALRPVGGWERLTSVAFVERPIRKMHAWRDLTDIARTAFGGDANLAVLEGSTYTDITPFPFAFAPPLTPFGGYGIADYGEEEYGGPRAQAAALILVRPPVWSLDNFGSTLLAMYSGDGRLLEWPTGTIPLPAAATVVSGAPVSNRCMLVTEERHIMLFGSGGVPYRVSWCSKEAPTDWNFASITNTAGFYDLGLSGWIVAAQRVRGGILIFTDADVWFARYVGAPYVYGFEKIGENCSLYSPYSVAASSSACVWMGRESFWVFDGGSVRPLPSDVGEYLFSDVDPTYGPGRVFASTNGVFPEVWWFYPSKDAVLGGSNNPDRYVVWSWAENWWANGKLARTAMIPSGVNSSPIMAATNGHLYAHERGWTDAGLSRVGQVYAETGPLAVQGGGRVYDVLAGHLDTGRGYGGTTVTAITSFTADGAEFTEGPYAPRTDGWLDMRFSARDTRFRLVAAEDTDWSIGEMRLEIAPAGER